MKKEKEILFLKNKRGMLSKKSAVRALEKRKESFLRTVGRGAARTVGYGTVGRRRGLAPPARSKRCGGHYAGDDEKVRATPARRQEERDDGSHGDFGTARTGSE